MRSNDKSNKALIKGKVYTLVESQNWINEKYLTDRLGGKEAWCPTHFTNIPDFFFIFQMNCAMTTLGLKEMGNFLWEAREKSLPTLAKLN